MIPNNNTITTGIECEPFLRPVSLRGTDFAFVSEDVRLNKSIAAFARVASAHRKETMSSSFTRLHYSLTLSLSGVMSVTS